ncbi:MAG: HD domain-containing protein [Spirochaetales bacterium]
MQVNRIIQHLDQDYTEPIRDPLWKHIHLSPQMMAIVASAPFQKLNRIKQLGIAHLVYPGATHTRFVHSLGVFHLAKRILRRLLASEEAPPLSMEGVKAFLCAALLHDIGHFPFTHSLKELPLREHESLTADLIYTPLLEDLLKQKIGTEPWMVAAIVDPHLEYQGNPEIPFFRNLLSGVLDPDKLDYLNRDAYFCGVPYGIQDTDFVISRIHPHPQRGISLDLTGLPAAENVLFSKYLMYRAVYWHRTVRIATAMIKKAVFLGLRDGMLSPDDLYGLDDEEFFHMTMEQSFHPFSLIRRVASRRLLKSIFETPFDPSSSQMGKLLDLEYRHEKEEEIAHLLSRELGTPIESTDVIIDIPERISFEIDIPILLPGGTLVEYADAGSVFSPPVVEGFVHTLRVLRVAVIPDVLESPLPASRIVKDFLRT